MSSAVESTTAAAGGRRRPVRRRRGRRGERGGHGLAGALATPGTLLLLLTFVVPVVLLVIYAFGTPDIVGRPTLDGGVTTQNFSLVFASYNLPVAIRTLAYAVAATLICIFLGYPVAYLAARYGGRFGFTMVVIVMAPWLVNFLVRIYGWRSLLAPHGLINDLLGDLGIPGVHGVLGSPALVVVGLVYGYLPMMVLPIYAAVGQLNPELITAGRDLYGSPVATFFHVTLPATREGVVGGVMLVFLPVLGDFATAQFLGGPKTTMLGNLISNQFTSSGSQPFGAALTAILIAALLIVVAIAQAAGQRRRIGGSA